MNIKYCTIILFIIIIFSISSVSATNETVTNNVDEISDRDIDSINSSNSNGNFNFISPDDNSNNFGEFNNFVPIFDDSNNVNDSAEYAGSDLNPSKNSNNVPILDISIQEDENKENHNYVDLSFKFKDYSFDINNKNYFFIVNQSFKNSSNENNKIMDVITTIKNNNLVLDVNFLNLSNQTVEVYSSQNFLVNVLDMIISFFISLFY